MTTAAKIRTGDTLDRIPSNGRCIVETSQADYLIDLDGKTLARWPVNAMAVSARSWDCTPLQIDAVTRSGIGSRLAFTLPSNPFPYVMEAIESITDVTSGFPGHD